MRLWMGPGGRRPAPASSDDFEQRLFVFSHAGPIETRSASRDRDFGGGESGSCRSTDKRKALAEHLRQASVAMTEAEHWATEAKHLASPLEAESRELRSQLTAVLELSSWRVIWPLRRAPGGHARTARAMRRPAKLAWWTPTLQLPRRIGARRKQLEPSTASTLSLPNPDPDDPNLKSEDGNMPENRKN